MRLRQVCLPSCALLSIALLAIQPAASQAPAAVTATAILKEIHVEGLTHLTQDQFIVLSGLQPGSQVSRKDLQNSADRLVGTGLFLDVQYRFETQNDELTISFHVKESPRLPVLFDNIPWFGDSELNSAIRARLPFYDGTLPAAGDVVDIAAEAIKDLIATHKLNVTLNHQVFVNPIGNGNVQEFTIQGPDLRIAKIEFSDPALAENRAVQQHVSEVVGKPFSRVAIDVFLTEHVRPIYIQKGYLRVKLGPAQIRLTGNPNLPLPTEIPVYIPIVPGPVYHFAGAQWSGNGAISTITLDNLLGFKSGQVADGMALQAAWQRISDEYGQRGYVDAKLTPDPVYDDSAHTISYKVQVQEGQQFHMGGFVLTGMSPVAEDRIRSTFPVPVGDIFNKIKYEEYLMKLQNHSKDIFGDLPIHYDEVGHWLRTDPAKSTVDVLIDFK